MRNVLSPGHPPLLSRPHAIVLDDPRGARVTYHPGYLGAEEENALFAWMVANAAWQREAPIIMGQPREARRRTCAYGEEGLTYRYSGIDRVALAWPPLLRPIVARLVEDVRAQFNFGLCNLYPDGEAGMGRHADDEREIERDSPIAGLSLGSTRDFIFDEKKGDSTASVALEPGSLVVMWGATQRLFKHRVPPRKKVKEARVNITFRVMVGSARLPRGGGD